MDSMDSKASKRFALELKRFHENPPEFVHKRVHVDPANLRNVYFLVQGPPDTPYVGGRYVVRLELAQDYPFSAPKIFMLTPNGRFLPDRSICMDGITSHHPSSFSCILTFDSILASVVSFWCSSFEGEMGGMMTLASEKRRLAGLSCQFNKKRGFDAWFE